MYLPYILAHFIGDFLLQNDWMAVGKKKSSWICTVHVSLYILPFLLTDLTYLQLSLIFIQHWLQDRTNFINWWCETTKSFQIERSKLYDALPWGHFVVDQIMHFIWIWIVVSFMNF